MKKVKENKKVNFENVNFNTIERKIIEVSKVVSLKDFKRILNDYQPKEIFNSHYSDKTPCWIITEYINEDNVKYYANAWSDKNSKEVTIKTFYDYLRIEGLNNCYVKVLPLKKAEL